MFETITNPVNLIIIIIGLFLGLVLGFFLLFNRSIKNSANIYLGLLILLSVTYFGAGFLFRFELMEKFPHFLGLYKLVNFLIGPLTYFYVRACIQKGFKMRPVLWLHFLPFLIDFLFNLPFFFQSGAEKIAYHKHLVQTGDNQSSFLFLTLVAVHSITYFVWAALLLFKYKKHLNDNTSSIDHAFYRWVLVFISIHALPVLTIMIAFIFTANVTASILLSLVGFFIFSVAVLFAIMIKPELFHAFPHQMLISKSSEEQKQKYESSNLQEADKTRYIGKLKAYMDVEKPYHVQDLTLAQLAEQVKMPANYVSQIINEKLECNFLDFINGYRTASAKAKLADPQLSHYTIMAIAYEAGFNSKSTFYAAFKKHTGMTPSQYRKQVKTMS